ncbi:potassium voltage-gated channel subfamily C member 3-like [Lineus longissimus]|uniref:potassium voltage-gated channel subfamily C member 3-like n=1 Tax=Lineus longissimus TaxID=88925 RepID=UPI002B4F5C82
MVMHGSSKNMAQQRLVLDIGGTTFSTMTTTVFRIPNSRLWRLTKDLERSEFVHACGTYYFDRNPVIFGAILDCYRTGEFHVPCCMCPLSVRKELDYWGIPDKFIAPCCLRKLQQHEGEEETLRQLRKELEHGKYASMQLLEQSKSRFNRAVLRSWLFLEFPNYSRLAEGWAIISGLLTVASIIVLACTSHPAFTQPFPHNDTLVGVEKKVTELLPGDKFKRAFIAVPHPIIVRMDQAINGILTIEFVFKFLVCPYKKDFFKSVLNWIDFVAFSNYWTFTAMYAAYEVAPKDLAYMIVMNVLTGFIALRIFRIFKLAGVFKGLRILLLVVKKNVKELATLIMFFIFGMLIFSTMIFYAELHIDGDFPSIIDGFWWSIITMTTVGYGDAVPSSYPGYVIGGMCALTGMLLSGLAIPIISNNFNLYYYYGRTYSEQMAKKETKQEVQTNRLDYTNSFTGEENGHVGNHHDHEEGRNFL